MPDNKKPPHPSPAQMHAWRSDEITIWLVNKLNNAHLKPDNLYPLKTQEQIAMANFWAGSQSVLEMLEKFGRGEA